MKIMLLPLLFLSSQAFSQDKVGHGGVSVVCRSTEGRITSAEILDIYEGRDVYGRTYQVNKTIKFETQIQLAQLKLDRHQGFLSRLQDELALAQANTYFVPNGSELEPTNDALPLIRKKGCKFEQLANYLHDGTLIVSEEIFNALDEVNKAALYIHEAVYAMRRKVGDEDSQKSRRLVGHLMAVNGDQEIIENLAELPTLLSEGIFTKGPDSLLGDLKIVKKGNTFLVEEYARGTIDKGLPSRTVELKRVMMGNLDVYVSVNEYSPRLHVYLKVINKTSFAYVTMSPEIAYGDRYTWTKK